MLCLIKILKISIIIMNTFKKGNEKGENLNIRIPVDLLNINKTGIAL